MMSRLIFTVLNAQVLKKLRLKGKSFLFLFDNLSRSPPYTFSYYFSYITRLRNQVYRD